MRYGFCTGFATTPLFALDIPLIKDVIASGYDFAELPLIALESAEESDIISLSSWFAAPVMCNLFPGSLSLYSGRKPIFDYLSRMLPRASRLGVKHIVFGSGKARTYPVSMSCEEAYDILVSLIRTMIAPMAEDNGITILIAPLSYGECNIINTLEEGSRLVKDVSHPAFSLMADLLHMQNNGENPAVLEEVFPLIKHVHIAELERGLPVDHFSDYVSEALSILKAEGYDRAISYETEDGDKKKALHLLQYFFR